MLMFILIFYATKILFFELWYMSFLTEYGFSLNVQELFKVKLLTSL
ncbi:Disease resistance protein RML1B [Bienertia sinuspersici]